MAVTNTVLVLAFLDLGVLTGESGMNLRMAPCQSAADLALEGKDKHGSHRGCGIRKVPLRK